MLFLRDLLFLVYPNYCKSCKKSIYKHEAILCNTCLADLPLTKFWLQPKNELTQLFEGKTNLESAHTLLYFDKHLAVQKLMHELKYNGNQAVGVFLGELYGLELQQHLYTHLKYDVVIPIPLHKNKLHKRGFNQAELIAKGLSKSLNIPMDTTSLIRTVNTETQTKKNREERMLNVKDAFEVTDSKTLLQKRILLVDDVLTTGSTLIAASNTILTATNNYCSISAGCVAFARY